MKILKVIHGYPPEYNAGSEIYSQTLCESMADSGHEVLVFTRHENIFQPDYEVLTKSLRAGVSKYSVNLPVSRHRYRYSNLHIDSLFSDILEKESPDIVHIGHLNHLSLSMLDHLENVPTVFTLHDFWLMCPRGQLIQRNSDGEPLKLCDGQEDRKCARECYSGYFSGIQDNKCLDEEHWTNWVNSRQKLIRKVLENVDLFISPSQYLKNLFLNYYPEFESKLIMIDYGFELNRFSQRNRTNENFFVFGYLGTHTPQKGIHILLNSLEYLEGNWRLRIWGRHQTETTGSLKSLISLHPVDIQHRIEWMGEYQNDNIMDVFNNLDCLIVPSVWAENSPLVIHEAQQARVPVITANFGGMKEFVIHGHNGLLFDFRNGKSLAKQMNNLIKNPRKAENLGRRGYLYSTSGDVLDMKDHSVQLEQIYAELIKSYGRKMKKYAK